jgi:hypothetical protein
MRATTSQLKNTEIAAHISRLIQAMVEATSEWLVKNRPIATRQELAGFDGRYGLVGNVEVGRDILNVVVVIERVHEL